MGSPIFLLLTSNPPQLNCFVVRGQILFDMDFKKFAETCLVAYNCGEFL